MNQVPIRGLTRAELAGRLAALGERPFRTAQVLRWLYSRRVSSFEAMTNLSLDLRRRLAEQFSIAWPAVLGERRAADGTAKYLFELPRGGRVEAVYMPNDPRPTVCVSTQIGCRMGCRFCATGALGLVRNLAADEILDQLLAATEAKIPGDRPNVVLMGMGEPLDNLDAVLRALEIMTAEWGGDWSRRKVTVGTVGIVPGIEALGASGLDVNLTVSLNAADQETRARLMPIARRYPLDDLMRALKGYPLRDRQRVTVAYVLIDGVNDRIFDARQLRSLLHGLRCKVNLIPYNPAAAVDPHWRAPTRERVQAFQDVLIAARYSAFIREPRGGLIEAACGQLRAAYAAGEGDCPPGPTTTAAAGAKD